MADYFRVFSYATRWDFCIYAIACFASIAGGATMPLSKQFHPQLRSISRTNLPFVAFTSRPSARLRLFFYMYILDKSWPDCPHKCIRFLFLNHLISDSASTVNIVFGQLVSQFTDYFRDSSSILPNAFDGVLDRQALYILALFVARWGLNSINKFCFQMIGFRLSSEIRLHYLEALLAQPIHAIDCMPAGGPATTITATSTTLQIGISDRLGTFLQFVSTIATAFIVSFIWSWDLTLVMMSLILYALVVISVVMPPIVKGQTTAAEADTQATAIASEALGGVRLIVACGAQSRIMSGYQKWVDEARRRAQKTAPILGIQFGLLVSSTRI